MLFQSLQKPGNKVSSSLLAQQRIPFQFIGRTTKFLSTCKSISTHYFTLQEHTNYVHKSMSIKSLIENKLIQIDNCNYFQSYLINIWYYVFSLWSNFSRDKNDFRISSAFSLHRNARLHQPTIQKGESAYFSQSSVSQVKDI